MTDKPHPQITRLQVKNFRSISELDLDLTTLIVFVGLNGAGKSNLVDVLRFVRDSLNIGLDQAILQRNGMNAIRRWTAKGAPPDIQIQLTIEGLDLNRTAEYGFCLASKSNGEFTVKWERASVSRGLEPPVTMEVKDGKLYVEKEKNPNVRPKDVSHTRLMLQTMNSLILNKLHLFLMNMTFYTLYTDEIYRLPEKPTLSLPLNDKGWNLASALRHIKKENKQAYNEIITAFQSAVEGVKDYSVQEIGGYLVIKIQYSSSDNKKGPLFPISQESDGTCRILGILTALYQIPTPTLISIEEPELNIHPGALGVLCDVLNETSLRSQVLLTTHSPELITRFPADVFRIVEKEKGITLVGKMKESQRQAIKDRLFSPGELLVMEGLEREETSVEVIGD